MEYLIIALGIIIDQISKWFAVKFLSEGSFNIIKDFFSLTLVKNYNGAFGLFGSVNSFLLPISIIISVACFWFMKKAKKNSYHLLTISVACIISGAIGNIIDRIAYGFVVDFIRIHLFDFPVFNVADILVVVGAFSAVLLLCFSKAGDIFDNHK
ncbi:MAG: signal peptidase II [Clostridia bacterium]|nr:signal peptidase II [Clostridia bacterium]